MAPRRLTKYQLSRYEKQPFLSYTTQRSHCALFVHCDSGMLAVQGAINIRRAVGVTALFCGVLLILYGIKALIHVMRVYIGDIYEYVQLFFIVVCITNK